MKKIEKPTVKLIRDKLREIIKLEEKDLPLKRRTKFARATRKEIEFRAVEKLAEESVEFWDAFAKGGMKKAKEEYGDFLEVFYFMVGLTGLDPRYVQKERDDKFKKAGGFDKWTVANFHPKTLADTKKRLAKKAKKQKQR